MPEPTYKDGWSGIDHTADPEYWVRFMDSIHSGRDEYPDANMGLFEMLQVREGHRVLDVGCGTGGAARAVSYLVKKTGHVVGLDRSETMIAAARQRTEGKDLPVEFMVGDIYALPFTD